MVVNRDAFLKAAPLKTKKVKIKNLGEICIREMNGQERDTFEASITGEEGKANTRGMRARLVMLCLCDEDGHRLFPNDEDFDVVNGKPASMLQEIADAIIELNGLKPEEVEGN